MRKNGFKLIFTVVLATAMTVFVPLIGQAVEPIKIGSPIPVTVPYAGDGLTMDEGIRLAIEDINAQGGLLGRPLEMIVFDVEDMLPEKVFASAEKLIGRDKVDFVVTGWCGLGPDVQAYGKYDVPYLVGNSSIRCIKMMEEDPNKWNILQMTHSEAAYGQSLFKSTMGLPYQFTNKKVAIIAGDFEWDRLFLDGFKKTAEENGWEVVMFEVVPYGTREWVPILTKMRKLEPSLLVVEILSPPDVVTLYRQFMESPTNTILQLGWSVIIPEFVEMLGAEGNGILGYTPCSQIYTPEAEAFKKRFKERYGKEPGGSSSFSYQGVMVWAEAVRNVGDPTDYKAVIKYMRENPYKKAIVGIMDWRETQYARTGPDYPMHLVQIQNGKAVDIMLEHELIAGRNFEIPSWIKR